MPGGIVTSDEWAKFLSDAVTPRFPGGFTVWLAGGGAKPGLSYGETDEMGYQSVVDRVHVHDLNATLLHLLGFDHEKLTYFFQGRNYRLTDVQGQVVKALLA